MGLELELELDRATLGLWVLVMGQQDRSTDGLMHAMVMVMTMAWNNGAAWFLYR